MEAMPGNPRTTRLRYPPKIIPSKNPRDSSSPIPKSRKLNSFPSIFDAQDVSPSAKIICDILARVSPNDIESVLSNTGINPSSDTVHEVLKLSYNYPSSAVKFFRWAGQIKKHTAHGWNLIVDLLGKNQLFNPMWDAVRSMKQERVLSMSTFASIFESYCMADMFDDAVKSFDVMDRYGIDQDVVAVNSLLSAMCREDKRTSRAVEFFDEIKDRVAPDGDTFCILLEGWEKEGNLDKAKTVFGEMIVRIGWSVANVAAYDTFLMTLVRGRQIDEAMKFLKVMKEHDCLPSAKFSNYVLDVLTQENDVARAMRVWNMMVSGGLMPTLIMYNAMIGLVCNNNETGHAFLLLDEMVLHGAFPDALTYNMIFECLVKNKRVNQAERFFTEMVKNECPPTHFNCAAAITMFFDCDVPDAANKIWCYMVDNHVKPLDKSANALLLGLCNLHRLPELRRAAEDMLHRRVDIFESTMRKLKDAFYREGRSGRDRYDHIYQRWRARS